MKTLQINPSILVLDRVTVQRGVGYTRDDFQEVANGEQETTTWKTTRVYQNKAESKLAESIYAKVRNTLRQTCTLTDVGFVCPQSKEADLQATIDTCKKIVDDANSQFTVCRVNFRCVCVKLEPSNSDGVASLSDALRDNVDKLRNAISNFDVVGARQLLYASKNVAEILADPSDAGMVLASRKESSEIINEIAALVKKFDGHKDNAAASQEGQAILSRNAATWNF